MSENDAVREGRRIMVHTRECKFSIGPGIDFRRKCTCGAKWEPFLEQDTRAREVA